MADDARMTELRRRVAADPASIAFAHLAEECRRTGATEEAVAICRKGLVRYPDYLSARVTLGRALIELGRLEEAQEELELVVAAAPDSLPAIRGLAEIHQGRGRLETALEYYRRAMGLARHDAELAETVGRISQEVAPPAPAAPATPPVPVEELFDFDALLAQLGETGTSAPVPPAKPLVVDPPKPRPLILARPPQPVEPVEPLELVEPVEPAEPFEPAEPAEPLADPFADLERELRVKSEDRARRERQERKERRRRRDAAILAPLEAWLSAIVADRERHARP